MNRERAAKELKRVLKQARREPKIAPETKKSVAAVILAALAAVLFLARFSLAGPAGAFLFRSLEKFFGWGYYLLPALALLIAAFFLINRERKLFSLTFGGAALTTLSALGLIDIFFEGKGGLVGQAAGALEAPFGRIAAAILAGAVFIASLLVTFNTGIRIPAFAKKERGSRELREEDLVVTAGETPPASLAKSEEMARAEEEIVTAPEPEEEPGEPPEVVIAEKSPPPKKQGSLLLAGAAAKNYVAPAFSLLKSSVEKPTSGDLRANANIIKRTLESFGVPVEMGEINIGPKVTRYTLKPAEGIKLARITALHQDLALALAAHPIRIEAPIPGKSLVGIEVPNKSAAIVRLGSLMAYPEFTSTGSLGFALGRDVSGEPIFTDIERMPHLLIAGATGSGKSVAIHSLLISLLYKNSPETLRLILIDPKRVELSVYEGIPHLVTPVVTDPKKSVGVFRFAIGEMDRRYEALLAAGARDVKAYNKNRAGSDIMPYLLIVVDELADLMATYGREVESSVVRLAQMARATGIHLVLSTQRPSVEVITGLIKANITSRIALQVASQVDSRTILDTAGAEKLLGGGDLLFISSEYSRPKRIQGAYVSEEEVEKVAEFVSEHNEPVPEQTALLNGNGETGGENGSAALEEYLSEDEKDELYEEAIAVVRESKKASASLLQRRLKVGYARAARLLDIMEADGLIGPGDGAKPRDVLL